MQDADLVPLRELERVCADNLAVGPFPYEEVRRLARFLENRRHREGLVQALDWYFSNVVGYASSASTLLQRRELNKQHSIHLLSRSFFDYFPEYRTLDASLTPEIAPQLCRQLQAADALRFGLLRHLVLDRDRSADQLF